MANKELAGYVMDQLSDLDGIRHIPMMGGYIFYYRERIFGGIYENGFLVKNTEAGRRYMPDSVPEPPYEGAREMLQRMVSEMYGELPKRKPRKSGKSKKEGKKRDGI